MKPEMLSIQYEKKTKKKSKEKKSCEKITSKIIVENGVNIIAMYVYHILWMYTVVP